MDTSPVSCRTLERFYHVDANTLEKQYKDVLSGYRTWEALPHADKWLVYPENIGPNLAIDETSVSRGDLYTVVTNRDRYGRTPKEAIDIYTIMQMRLELLQTDTPIAELAWRYNFSSPSFFSDYFRRNAGTSPQQYRRQNS